MINFLIYLLFYRTRHQTYINSRFFQSYTHAFNINDYSEFILHCCLFLIQLYTMLNFLKQQKQTPTYKPERKCKCVANITLKRDLPLLELACAASACLQLRLSFITLQVRNITASFAFNGSIRRRFQWYRLTFHQPHLCIHFFMQN